MVSRSMKMTHQPRISDMDKKYFKEIFLLEARIHEGFREPRIDYEAL